MSVNEIDIERGELLYENPLNNDAAVADWIREGQPVVSFPMGRLRLENGMAASEGQASNYLFWCPEQFPADIIVRWRFRPLREPGLAMFWFSATGTEGRDLFDPSLAERTGQYRQYFDGDINAYHLSYFRRKNPEDERAFHTCNMRKSHGFHLVTQGADPIPSVIDVHSDYQIELVHCQNHVRFSINDLPILQWFDDGSVGGPPHGPGRIGFRQMAPLIAEYADLKVYAAKAM
jgi:hypothetical protein